MIKENIQKIISKLEQGVRLVVVSKFRPLNELEEAYACGQRIFAESRPSEFEAKVLALPKDIEWHFIGHLQTNKLRHVLPYVSMIHSVDSVHLLQEIEKWCAGHDRIVKVLLEVHIGAEESKYGFSPEEIASFDLSKAAVEYPHIVICGLMGMASNTDDVTRIEADFTLIESLFIRLRKTFPKANHFTELSIGMSSDWPIALRHGATLLRIGSSIFE